jgi:ureidoacrylate peracid hydrolase
MRARPLWTVEERIAPAHTALVVIDMQNDYCDPQGANARRGRSTEPQQAILPGLRTLIDAARAAGAFVVFVRNIVDPLQRTHSPVALVNEAHVWADERVSVASSWGSQVVDALGARPDDLYIDKNRNSAFQATPLEMILRSNGIQTVVIAGQATFACVDCSARDALNRDFYTVVVRDAVAATREETPYHEASLMVLEHFLPKPGVVTAKEILAVWARAKRE